MRLRDPRHVVASTLLLAALALPTPSTAQGTGAPGQGIFLPFAPNETWYVCQGYRGTVSGTHNNNFSLDLTRDPSGLGTAGCFGDQDFSENEPVYAPGAGELSYYERSDPTWDDMVCLDLEVGGSLLIGHLTPASRIPEGPVDAEDFLGLVAEPSLGDNGIHNGDYSHIHIQAYSGDDCTGGAEPFEGDYKFFGVPDLPDLRPFSALDEYRNHYFGTGFSYLIINPASDDAGMRPAGCSESTGYNEIYLGNCPNGARIHSGLRFHHLPVNQGEWVSAASLVVQTDGLYSSVIHVNIRGENSAFAQTFAPGWMPSDRLPFLLPNSVRWSIADPWQWRQTRETTNLRTVLQPIVDRADWTRSSSKFVLVLSGASGTSTTHRRFMATERDPINIEPDFYPARVFVTQFRTRNPGENPKGNNRPVADAGPDRFYTSMGEKISLDGTGSFDPDDHTISYKWTQLAGPTVTLFGDTTASPRFNVFGFGESYAFELRVTDDGPGQLQGVDTVVVSSGVCDPFIC